MDLVRSWGLVFLRAPRRLPGLAGRSGTNQRQRVWLGETDSTAKLGSAEV